MIRKPIIFVIALLICINMGCTYSESGIYFSEPIAGDPPTVSISTNLDTIILPLLTDSLKVEYQVDIENGEFYQVETYYLEELIHIGDTTQGIFYVFPLLDQLPGIDTLRLYFFHSTNANSIADILGVDYDFIILDYPVNYVKEGEQ